MGTTTGQPLPPSAIQNGRFVLSVTLWVLFWLYRHKQEVL
jgi:hypothetical protein